VSSSSGSGERPRSARPFTSSSDSRTRLPPRPSTGSKIKRHNHSNNTGNLPNHQSSSLSSSSNDTNNQQRTNEKVQEKIEPQQSLQSVKQLAQDTNQISTTTSALTKELSNMKHEVKNILSCLEGLITKNSHLTTTLTSTQTAITDMTKKLEGTVGTLESKQFSANETVLSLEEQPSSSTPPLAQPDESNAADCKQSAHLRSEVVTLNHNVEELVGETEGLKESLNKIAWDKEDLEKRLKEVETDHESANIKVGVLKKMELVGVREKKCGDYRGAC